MIVAFVWLYAWALGEFILKPTHEAYKIKYTRISKMQYTRILIFSIQSNEESVLKYIAPTYSSVNSIELEFHVGSVCSAHPC
jgi:hypothetical protein